MRLAALLAATAAGVAPVRFRPSAICPAIASARLAAMVRYCASDCDDTAVLLMATSPRMPSAKMRMATIASMRKKPRCDPRAERARSVARTTVPGRSGKIAGLDLPSLRNPDATAVDRPARAGGRIADVDHIFFVAA